MIRDFLTQLRLAMRTLFSKPQFALTAIGTLAVGIAACITVTSVLDAYLIRSLPYPGADRLYDIRFSAPDQRPPEGLNKLDWAALSDTIEQSISWDLDIFYLTGASSTGGQRPQTAPGTWVTPGFMDGLGIRPQLGRAFQPEEFRKGAPQVALISHAMWQDRFGGDPAVVGKTFSAYVSDRPDEADLFTIVGVMPADFWHLNRFTQVFAPLRVPNEPYMIRLRPGVSVEEATERVTRFMKENMPALPADFRVRIYSTHGQYASRVRPILLVAAAAASLVMLIACANVAFLLTVRAAARQKEIQVRLALGASRGQIARMLGAEALVLGGCSALLAMLLVAWGLDSVSPAIQQQLGRSAPGAIALGRAGVLAGAAALAITMLFGMLPLAVAWSANANLRGNRTYGGGRATARMRHALIALEIGGSLALLGGAVLMVRTTWNLLRTDLGYTGERVLTAHIGLRQRAYPTEAARAAFVDKLETKMRAIPGVKQAALSSGFTIEQARPRQIRASGPEFQASVYRVSSGFFGALGIPVIAGRGISSGDRLGGEPVAVVSESFARRVAGSAAAAIGQQVMVDENEATPRPEFSVRRRIVGVTADIRQSPRDPETLDLFLPVAQSPSRFYSVYLSTEGAPAQWIPPLQQALREVDAEVPLDAAESLQLRLDQELTRPRFLSWLLAGLGAFGTVLALLGVYALVAFAVKQRELEVAIRMAVGASPGSVVRLFLEQGAWVAAAGIGIGVAGAYALGRALESQLHGVPPHDPLTLIATAAAIALAALLAMAAPTRRAARSDPAALLRQD